jgi:hypothetical protein
MGGRREASMHATPNLLAVILFSTLAVSGSWSAAAQRLPSHTQAPASCTGDPREVPGSVYADDGTHPTGTVTLSGYMNGGVVPQFNMPFPWGQDCVALTTFGLPPR